MKDEYRVIIWGLGSVGKSALEIINARKSLKLVGAFDVNPDKVGKDAGEALGLPTAGVIVSDNEEDVLAIDADIVLYYPPTKWDAGKLPSPTSVTGNVDDIVKFLEHGKNCAERVRRARRALARIDAAGKANGTTYVQQGIFPGIFTPYFSSLSCMFSRTIDTAIVYGGEDDSVNSAPWIAVFGYGKKLDELSGKKTALQNLRRAEAAKVCAELKALGLNVGGKAAAECLFTANFGDIIDGVIVSKNVAVVVENLRELMMVGDVTASRRYYGMYLVLVDVQIACFEDYLEKSRGGTWRGRLDRMREDAAALRERAQSVMASAN